MNKTMNNLLLFIMFFSASVSVIAGPCRITDSTGVEKKDGKLFILHKVDPKETLFSISKKYGATVDDIKKYNPTAAAGLKIGQIVKVPSKATAAKTTETTQVKVVQNTQTTANTAANPKTHKVAAKETLFSISKKYGVSVDDLKKANPGSEAGLKLGQVLNIPGKQAEQTTVVTKTDNTSTASDNEVKVKKDNTANNVIRDVENNNTNAVASKKQEDLSQIKTSSNTSTEGGYTKITETGVAEMMEDNSTTPKYLALHKTAAVGTIIEVLNQTTNQKIFVKVIGPLNVAADSNVIIQISQKAFQRLTGDKKMKVEISYIP
ncbi:MAG: LysM peptidoglycan-binding domain-containing protein [Cytophagaceae bacterium]